MRCAAGSSFLAASLLCAIAAGCDDGRSGPYFGNTDRGAKDPATLIINTVAEPEHLDPGKSVDTVSAQLIHAMFEGLTALDPRDLRPVQGVALRWEQSEDGRVLRFHLRPEARWSDGQKVTSHDFAYAWRRALRPETASRAAPNLYPLKNGELFNKARLKVARRDLTAAPLPGSPPRGVLLAKGEVVLVLEGGAPEGKRAVARYRDLPTYAERPAGSAPGAAAKEPIGLVDEADLASDDAVVGVRATDDLTLDVELERPTPYFLDLTSRPAFAPVRRDVVEAFEQRGAPDLWTRPESIVVNGPYTIEAWAFRDAITMKQNPHYWARDTLRLERVVWLEIDRSHSAMNLYKVGDLDVFGSNTSIPPEYRALVEPRRDHRRFPLSMIYWYQLNTRARPLEDARVRRALNQAVDKQALVEKVTRGGELPATHYVPEPTGSGYAALAAADRAAGVDPFADAIFDPARARALLQEAGYPIVEGSEGRRARGFPPLEILYPVGDDGHRNIAVAIQDMWRRELGVSVTLRSEEWKVMLKSVRDGQFQLAAGGWVADYNHPHTFLETFLASSTQNAGGWADRDFDALLARAADEVDPGESARLYRRAERLAVGGMSRVPLFFPFGATLIKPWVKGFYGNGRTLDLVRWIWIDPAWRDHPGDEPSSLPLELPPPGRLKP